LPTSTSWNYSNPNCDDLDQLKPLVNSSQAELDPAITLFLNYTFPTIVDGYPDVMVNGNHFNATDFSYPTLFGYNENPSWEPTEQRNLIVISDSMMGKELRLILHSLPARDGRNHPFHRHGGGFKVLATGTSEITQDDLDKITSYNVLTAVERDTVVVPKDGWVATQYVSSYVACSSKLMS
jgi:Multicopper oxidase